MREVRLRPRAAQDIEAIADYTIEKWGTAQAKRYVTELRQSIESLALVGLRHAPCPDIAPDLRRARSGRHLIYFRIDESVVDVVRVLHERMDAGASAVWAGEEEG